MSEQNVVDSPSEQFDGGGFDNDFDGNDSGSGDASVAPGMGQSKSSRRRRRKRKNKVGGGEGASEPEGDSPAAAAPFVMEGESIALAAPQKSRRQQSSQQNSGTQQAGGQQAGGQQSAQQAAGQPSAQPSAQQNGQQQPGQGPAGKRWKKKFRDRDRRQTRSENPGNDFRADSNGSANNGGGSGFTPGYRSENGGGGFKRKNKGGGGGGGGQRKERSFVGPMDHSYREANGNVDLSSSTTQMNGRRGGHRHHGDSQPIDHSMPRPVPIPENAQTHIYFFVEELFFQAKIQETARKLGVKVAFLKSDKDVLADLTSGEEIDKPALIVIDLNNANAKPLTLIPKLKAKLKRSASIVGFLSHLQGDLKAKAVEAGCDTVMPRSAFSQNLPNLLRRYGVQEEEEINYNY